MDIKQLKVEIKNLKDMLDDALTEAAAFNACNDYIQVEECGIRIVHLSRQIQLRQKHLEDHINFKKVITDLKNRGIIVETVKRIAN